MAHLIEAIRESSLEGAIELLQKTHALIVEQAIHAQRRIGTNSGAWGAELKRLEVSLPAGQLLIGKACEKFVEIINILATTERTISSLVWLAQRHPNTVLRECHASTSDDIEGNDIVLLEAVSRKIVVRCEVTDVISSNAAQNGKEKKDLRNLGCGASVPKDGVIRYIATSYEFSQALMSKNRKWASMHYRYIPYETKSTDQTVMLEIVNV